MGEQEFKQTGWMLDALLPAREGEPFETIVAELEQQVRLFEESRERLLPEISGDEFLELICLYESIGAGLRRLSGYAHLWFSEDTQSQDALGFLGRMEELVTDVQNRLLFFSLWWKSLDPASADRLVAISGDYAYYLESLRRFEPYTLSEPEEKLINLKDVNGPSALVKLYEMITNRFSFSLDVDGEVQEMTRGVL